VQQLEDVGDEQFDVLHLHEPFIPGPTQTAMRSGSTPGSAAAVSTARTASTYMRR